APGPWPVLTRESYTSASSQRTAASFSEPLAVVESPSYAGVTRDRERHRFLATPRLATVPGPARHQHNRAPQKTSGDVSRRRRPCHPATRFKRRIVGRTNDVVRGDAIEATKAR